MRIHSVRIENFRSIRDATCAFGEVTSLIGPNGAGKSNILRALDWFFNGTKDSLGTDDLHFAAPPDSPIRVQVEFHELTAADREALGPRYCPDDDTATFTAWRTWRDGEDKMSGRAKACAEFETIRAESKAADRRRLYTEVRDRFELAAWANMEQAEAEMRRWELNNPDELTDAEVSASHFFGINGRGVLSQLFDFVFVSADLRASEETVERHDSLLERIVSRAVDREQFNHEVIDITKNFEQSYRDIGDKLLSQQLIDISTELTSEINNYSPGRSVHLSQQPGSVKLPVAAVDLRIADRGANTPVENQGHGFQRTLLLAGLSVLSRHGRAEQSSSMFLAIEEPELFQHPTQAKAFASVLRGLATAESQRTQVAYATHSPHFVSPQHFDEVRRISSTQDGGGTFPSTRIAQATIPEVQTRLDGFVSSAAVARRFEQVCLKHLPSALFAESVILVEGDDDAAIIEGVGRKVNELAVNGTCVAPVAGKSGMMIPFAILELLGVQTLMVVDNDSGCGDRMRNDGKDEDDVRQAEEKHRRDNRALCRFVGEPEEDYPVGAIGPSLAFVPDTLESLLESDLPGWTLSRQTLIDEGRGVGGKHAGTYALAVQECDDELGPELRDLAEICTSRAA